MRLIGIKSAKNGNVLAMPIHSSSGKVILNAGFTLTDKFIDKLKDFGVNKIYIEDERFNDVEIREALDLKTRNDAEIIISDMYELVNNEKMPDEYAIKDISKRIVEFVREEKDRGVSILSTSAVDDYIIEHSINVAILSAFIGNKMDFNFGQLCDLVTGALIHDIGRENFKEEHPEHVNKGFETMRKCRGLSLHSSIVCHQHHENYNGSGYPRSIKGSEITEFTRIVRVADYYDNALHGYDTNDDCVMPHQAYEYLLAVSGSVLDPEIVERFRDTIIFYPNGCTVLLSNGLKAAVVKQNLGSPQRPLVRVYNDMGVIGEVDLLKSLTLFIKMS